MRPVIVLLTDFGLSDPYVAQMKGAILSRRPETAIVDLTHDVPPFGLSRAALFLQASRTHFPEGAVFVAVVDPGVGTPRRIVALTKGGRTFLAPDNGLLGLVLADDEPARAFDLSARAQQSGVSATFHGRDVFAPLAADLAGGAAPESLGLEIDPGALVRLPWAEPQLGPRGVRANVLHVDRFGNCLTNLPVVPWAERHPLGSTLLLAPALGASRPLRRVSAYGELAPGQLGLVAGSQGYLELCLNQASAAAETGLAPGEAVFLEPIKGNDS